MEALAIGSKVLTGSAPGWARDLSGVIDRLIARERELASWYAVQAEAVPQAWRGLAGACLVSISRLPLRVPVALRWHELRSPGFGLAVDLLAAAAEVAQARGLAPEEAGAVALFEEVSETVRDVWAAMLGAVEMAPAEPLTPAAAYDLAPPSLGEWARARQACEMSYGNPAALSAAVAGYLHGPVQSAGMDRALVALLAGQVIVARLAALRLPMAGDPAPLAVAEAALRRARNWRWRAVLGGTLAAAGSLSPLPVVPALALVAGVAWQGASVMARRQRDPAHRVLQEVEALDRLLSFLHGGPFALGDLRERLAAAPVDWPPVLRVLVEDIAARGVTRL